MKNLKLIYIVIPILIFVICLIIINVIDNNYKGKNYITQNNNTTTFNSIETKLTNETQNNSEIRINTLDSTRKSLSIDAKWEDVNLKEEFVFLNNLYIPDNLKEIRQGKVYTKQNLEDNDYSEFRQYSIMFTDSSEEEISNIELVFSNKKLLSDCIPVGLENADTSVIEGVNVKIFATERLNEPSLISGEVYLEYNNYNYDIKCYRLSQEEFLKTINSLIQEIK